MGAVTAVSRGFGFLRVLVIAAVLGTTYLGNAFQAANSVSNVLFELVAAGALSAVLVPTFVQLLDKGDDEEANRLASGLLGIALVGLGIVTVVGIVGAPLLARLLTAGVENDAVAAQQRVLETYLLRWFLPQLLLYACGTIATGVLSARRRFAITAAAPIGNTIVMVGGARSRSASWPVPIRRSCSRRRSGCCWSIAGTGGVIAFVGDLGRRRAPQRVLDATALEPAGPRHPSGCLGLSAWGVLLHANAGILLGAALVVGSSVAGGVVAYQVAFVFFLAPYAVLAQPILTAFLPELVGDAERGDIGFVRGNGAARARSHGRPRTPRLGRDGRARIAHDAASSRSGTPRAPASSCSPPHSRRSRSACSRTARSCSSRACVLRAR